MFEAMRGQSVGEKTVEALVVDNNDPLQLRRLKVRAESIHPSDSVPDSDLPWAICGVFAGQGPSATAGHFSIPIVGALVSIWFQQGDPDQPVYDGSITSLGKVPAIFQTNYPNRVGVLVKNGSSWYVDPVSNEAKLTHRGTTVVISASGEVTVTSASHVNFNVTGNLNATVSGDATLAISGNMSSSASQWTHTGNFTLTGNYVQAGTFAVTGATFKHNGIRVGSDHTHGGVRFGTDISAGPTTP